MADPRDHRGLSRARAGRGGEASGPAEIHGTDTGHVDHEPGGTGCPLDPDTFGQRGGRGTVERSPEDYHAHASTPVSSDPQLLVTHRSPEPCSYLPAAFLPSRLIA